MATQVIQKSVGYVVTKNNPEDTSYPLPNVNAIYGPYLNKTEAYNACIDIYGAIENIPTGVTVGIIVDGKIVEYWFKEDKIGQPHYLEDLVVKVDFDKDSLLTDEQKEALDELVESKNPLTVTMTGGGSFEIGSTYSPSGIITVKKGSTDVLSSSTVTINSGTVSGATWSDSDTTSNKTWTITAVYNSKTASKSVSASFLPYLYQGVVSSSDVTVDIVKSLNKSLSNDVTKGATNLAAGKYYIFACKGTISLVCRENSTNGIVSATTGTIDLERVNGTATDTYSYIVIPASEMEWTFKITNS